MRWGRLRRVLLKGGGFHSAEFGTLKIRLVKLVTYIAPAALLPF